MSEKNEFNENSHGVCITFGLAATCVTIASKGSIIGMSQYVDNSIEYAVLLGLGAGFATFAATRSVALVLNEIFIRIPAIASRPSNNPPALDNKNKAPAP